MKLSLTALAVAIVCFGIGMLMGKSSNRSSAGNNNGADGRGARSTGIISALPTSSNQTVNRRAANAAAALSKSPDAGLFNKMRGFLRLVQSAELEEIPALMVQIHREMPDGADFAIEMLAERWAKEDPFGAMQAMLDNKPLNLVNAYRTVTKHAVEADPKRAWEMMQGLGEDGGTTQGILGTMNTRVDYALSVLGHIADDNPALAIDLMQACEDRYAYEDGFSKLLVENITHAHPGLVLDRIKQFMPAGNHRTHIIGEAIGMLTETDREAAIQIFHDLSPSESGPAFRSLTTVWGHDDPAAALQWALERPLNAYSEGAFSSAIGSMAIKDPQAAVASLEQLDSSQHRYYASLSLVESWFRTDQDAAMTWLREEMEPATHRAASLKLLGEHGEKLEFELQRELAESIQQHSQHRTEFVTRWANADPKAATDWAVAHAGDDGNLVPATIKHWHGQDADAALAYIEGLPDSELRTSLRRRFQP